MNALYKKPIQVIEFKDGKFQEPVPERIMNRTSKVMKIKGGQLHILMNSHKDATWEHYDHIYMIINPALWMPSCTFVLPEEFEMYYQVIE